MTLPLVDKKSAIPVHRVTKAGLAAWLDTQDAATQGWAVAAGFKAEAGAVLLLPGAKAGLKGVAVGVPEKGVADMLADAEIWALAGLPMTLPEGNYALAEEPEASTATNLALGWALGAYSFDRYKKKAKRKPATLNWPKQADRTYVTATAEATMLGRDLITTPAADMGPQDLAAAARGVAKKFGAKISVITGDELLKQNYPAVHAVGRASAKPPCLIDITWSPKGAKKSAPKITLVGKGVCFDSGGLDIKPAGGMLLMKKDMGGAATVLSLASLIMATGLKVRLRVLIPAVENMISGDAFRPLDVLSTRKGITVEVGNTDAEGRLILCDALAEADSEKPDLLIDCATLTGAARVALGPELPAVFTRHDDLAREFETTSLGAGDPVWRLPLWPGYRRMIDSKVADISSTGDSPFAGAVTAAIYLSEFVSPETPWMHIDLIAWNTRPRPGRPEGGEPQTLRGLYALIRERFR